MTTDCCTCHVDCIVRGDRIEIPDEALEKLCEGCMHCLFTELLGNNPRWERFVVKRLREQLDYVIYKKLR
jgi:hypothetical protein